MNAHQSPGSESPPLLPTRIARRLSSIILRLWWAAAILFTIQLAQTYAVIRGIPNMEFWRISDLIGLPASMLFHISVWQLVLRAKLHWNQPHLKWANLSVNIFLATTLLCIIYAVLGVFARLLPWWLPPAHAICFGIPNFLITYVSPVGYLFGVSGIFALACSIRRQAAGDANFDHYGLVAWIACFALGIALACLVASRILWMVFSEPDALPPDSVMLFLTVTFYLGRLPIIPTIWCLLLLIPIRRRLKFIALGHHCLNCGYDLRGDAAGPCSECGWGRAEALETVTTGPVESEDEFGG